MKLYFSQIQLVMQFVITYECPFKKPILCTNDKFKASKHARECKISMGSKDVIMYFCVPHEDYPLPDAIDLSPNGTGKDCKTFEYHFQKDKLTLAEEVTFKKKLTWKKKTTKQGHFKVSPNSAKWELEMTVRYCVTSNEYSSVFDFGCKNFDVPAPDHNFLRGITEGRLVTFSSGSHAITFLLSAFNIGQKLDKFVIGSSALDQHEFIFLKTVKNSEERFYIHFKCFRADITPYKSPQAPRSNRNRQINIVPTYLF
ncbi:unnamed protein product [Albugo candida]|uniref:Uncharacterized protein n=1 Tax=Albugo candida TaxID=65357 RepID=A0A024GKY9_9STRA|nr:unnamed protein product [Albugo candida]|eukprot:CCI47403.1 unnamed protein product [Albugo candida]